MALLHPKFFDLRLNLFLTSRMVNEASMIVGDSTNMSGTDVALIGLASVADLWDKARAMSPGPMTLEEFITMRRAELVRAQADLRAQLQSLVDEQKKLDRAAYAAGLPQEPIAIAGAAPVAKARKVRRASGATIKDAVVQVLTRVGHGVSAIDLLPLVNDILGVDYPRSSLSPQLSRLKSEGILTLRGKLWLLRSEPENENPADAAPAQEASTGLDVQPSAKGGEARPGGGT